MLLQRRAADGATQLMGTNVGGALDRSVLIRSITEQASAIALKGLKRRYGG